MKEQPNILTLFEVSSEELADKIAAEVLRSVRADVPAPPSKKPPAGGKRRRKKPPPKPSELARARTVLKPVVRQVVHDYSAWPIPEIAPTTETPDCGCDAPIWADPSNAAWGCGNCCHAAHPHVYEQQCHGRRGRWYAAFVRAHDQLLAAIEARELDPYLVPVSETEERVVSLRRSLVEFIELEFVRVSDGSYRSNGDKAWSGMGFAKTFVGNMFLQALDSLGYPSKQELDRALAIVEGRDLPDFGLDPRRVLHELRAECMLCSAHYDEDKRRR